MSMLAQSRRAAMAEGQKFINDVISSLGAGQHLLSVRVETESGRVLPARVLIDAAGPELCGIVTVEPSQMEAFATVLGAGMQSFGSTVTVVLRSSPEHGRTKGWIKSDWDSELRVSKAPVYC
ncbi:hypothetical protein AB0N79_38780 [Streptomyces microflavus]|uniref:hypothetical protein n=1 Tax=Streptomyces microflavus TaxID=1919 RepID=UPI002251B93C|nr:hypothetical protein [Streptomyces microflavus]MCX4657281.1 hypothetical protein [Streptomyces microflavus]